MQQYHNKFYKDLQLTLVRGFEISWHVLPKEPGERKISESLSVFISIDKINMTKSQDKLLRTWVTTLNLNIPFILWDNSIGFAQDTFGARLAQF